MKYYRVAVSRPLGKYLDYHSELNIETGSMVKVPLAKSTAYGFIIKPVHKPEFKTKAVNKVFPIKYFNKDNYKIYEWISSYYHYPIGELLKSITPSYIPSDKVLKKIHETIDKQTKTTATNYRIKLNQEQQLALDTMTENIPYVLHGVTGSGKTEVYIEKAKEVIKSGKSVIILVPEIALTPQLLDRISKYFSGQIAVIHSSTTPKEKFLHWQSIIHNKAKLIIGVRSAIFSPVKDLGLIVVDEEHDSSYKQNDRLKYNTRDIAVMMGRVFNIPVILSSATPSLETYYNAKINKYKYIKMTRQIHKTTKHIKLIDMKKAEKITNNISFELYEAIQNTVKNSKQVLLFLNRRGFSRSIVCQDCGEVFLCPNCSVSLTMHKKDKKLKCHYCSYERKTPNFCHKCGSHNLLTVGSGTEKLTEELKNIFPNLTIQRVDSDVLSKKNAISKFIADVNSKKIDIIVGTQIIIKGHDFKNIGLVGIINTDLGLQIPDFRSSELVFQQIIQVNGRTARHGEGTILAQSYMPEYPAIKLALNNKLQEFYEMELKNRKAMFYPPYSKIADIRVSHSSLTNVKQLASTVYNLIKSFNIQGLQIFGPSPSPIEKLNNKYRYHILLKAKKYQTIQLLASRLEQTGKIRKLKISLDIDPYSLF